MAADLVTLSWCLGEIRDALAQTETLLEGQLGSDVDGVAALRTARASLHQAHGALQMVDIEGTALITREAERLLDAVERGEVALSAKLVSVLSRAFHALVEHLETLMAEVPHQPLYLFPYYRGLLEARNADRIQPADLFFPDLSVRAPEPWGGYRDLDPTATAGLRSAFERGLLQVMRGADPAAGARAMRDAIDTVASSQACRASRAFWWVTQAWFEALAQGEITVDLGLKRLLGRLNLQLRKTVEERAPVPEQLMRDLLFMLATLKAPTPMAVAVRSAYRIDDAVPADYDQPRYGRLDARVLREAREALAKGRSAFDKVTRGQGSELATFSEQIDLFCDAVQQMPAEGLRALGRALAEVRAHLGGTEGVPGDALSLELATTILFAEQALEEGARPGSDHDQHGQEMATRLRASLSGQSMASEAPEWLRNLSRAAQERMTMLAFIAETGNNLRAVEKTLDAFFREPGDRQALPECVRALHQVAGALRLLGQDAAASGAESMANRVAILADAAPAEAADAADPGEGDPAASAQEQAEFERIASSVGALGFFIEGLHRPDRQAGRFEFDAATGDFVAYLGRTAPLASAIRSASEAHPVSLESTVGDSATRAGEPHEVPGVEAALAPTPAGGEPRVSVESTLEEHAGEAVALLEALVERPDDLVLRSALRETVGRVRDAAMLLDRGDVRRGADDALSQLRVDQGALDLGRLVPALEAAGIAVPSALEPSAPMPTDAAAIDSELLEIFLGEAEEVLKAIDVHTALARAEPADVEYLTTIRRGFHTLKGSGRMVGLNDFGEAGWALEQVMNQWLGDEKPADEHLIDLLDIAVARMTGWVENLRADPASVVTIDPAELIAAAEAVRDGRAPVAVEIDSVAAMPSADVASDSHSDECAHEAPVDRFAFEVSEDVESIELTQSIDLTESLDSDLSPEFAQPTEPAQSLDAGSFDAASLEGASIDAAAIEGAPIEGTPIDIAPIDATPLEAAFAPPAEPSPIVRIGDRELSRPLYEIFVSEAEELLGKLVDGVRDWQAHPARGIGGDALRAAHSLAGSSTIVRLDSVHRITESLEAFMLAQRACAESPSEAELQLVADAVGRLKGILDQFAQEVDPSDEVETCDAVARLAAAWRAKLQLQPQAAAPDDLQVDAGPDDLDDVNPEDIDIDALVEVDLDIDVDQDAADDEGGDAEAAPTTIVPADELDPDLLPVFIEEATDQMPEIGEILRRWLATPADGSHAAALMRLLHTVKGGARMAGAMALGQRLHDIETRVEALAGLNNVPLSLIDELISEHDRAMMQFDALRNPQPQAPVVPAASAAPGPAATSRPAAAQAVPAATASAPLPVAPDATPVAEAEVAAATAAEPATEAEAAAATATAAAPTRERPARRQQPLVRVRADLLDRLVNEAGEVSIARSRLDNGLTGLRQSLADLTENVARLRSQLREIEIQAESQIQARNAKSKEQERDFDPLEFDRFTRFQELTRMLAESVNDVATVQHNALRTLDDSSQDLHRQGQVLRDLQQNLMRVRMLQFGSISDRLYRVVRQAAKELDKRVSMDIRGASVEIDRGVLERMAGPIEHLLRNAVAHGIESRERRAASGKPETGEIAVEVRQEGNEIVLSFSDDGAGLDHGRIRARAIAAGLVSEDVTLTDRALGDLIFTPGFSTADSVTEVSGRGVGMDVVRSEVVALGGRIETTSAAGQGTRFTVHLPLTLAVAQVVLVSVGAARFAVSSSSVEQLLQLKPQALASAYAERSVEWQGMRVPLFYLGSLVEMPDQHPVAQHYSPVLILRSGHQRIALHCDEVTRNQEVVVKSVGPQVSRVRGVTGATVLGNGEIVLIANPVAFAQVAAGEVLDRVVAAPRIAAASSDMPAIVMVVDDSVTVRKVTQRLLAREGYQVMLAKDGVDALRQLQDTLPDVILLDIEMPRMDGFDLTRHLRADERCRDVPIIMISSRTADKHRNHAKSLGVNLFLGKPYGEEELLARVAGFARHRRQPALVG